MDFTNPGILGSYRTFQEEFESKINKHRTESEKRMSYKYSVMLRSIIEPFILRRDKSQIVHKLPEKKDKVIFVRLSDSQKSLYIRALESKRIERLKRFGCKSSDDILGAISYLRKICNHPGLVNFISYDNYTLKSYKDLLCDKNSDCDENCVNSSIFSISDSSKVQVALELIDGWKTDGKRALVFFQTVQMLRVFENILTNRHILYNFQVMTGTTPVAKRAALISNFNENSDIFIFLLTTKVGGFGLNLTGASRIIIFDPDWNPSTDNQAKERIYRFGQISDVEIYRLITKNTIEEKVYEKQIYKDCLSRKILNNPDTAFKKQYFFDLFSFCNDFDTEKNRTESGKMLSNKQDCLIEVKEEDKLDFKILKELNSKILLSGKEIIEYIIRREANLQD